MAGRGIHSAKPDRGEESSSNSKCKDEKTRKKVEELRQEAQLIIEQVNQKTQQKRYSGPQMSVVQVLGGFLDSAKEGIKVAVGGILFTLRVIFTADFTTMRKTAKWVWQSGVEGFHHVKTGATLLAKDVEIASRLAWKSWKGKTLTRRERRNLTRTTGDIFKMIPFSAFLLIPFLEFLLPVALIIFPNMLPSTFVQQSKLEEDMKKRVKLRLELAKFLQETAGEMAREVIDTKRLPGEIKTTAKEFVGIMKKVKLGEIVSNEELVSVSKLFRDELTLDQLPRTQLIMMCRYMDLTPYGTDSFLRYQLRQKLSAIKSDDNLIQKEGIESLSYDELTSANRKRGMPCMGIGRRQLEQQLEQWLDLSLNTNLPPSLLILSRSFNYEGGFGRSMQSAKSEAVEAIEATLAALPEEVVNEVEQSISDETSDTLDATERKIQHLIHEQELMKDEEEEAAEVQAAMEAEEKEAEQASAEATSVETLGVEAADAGLKDNVSEVEEFDEVTDEEVAAAASEKRRIMLQKVSEGLSALASSSFIDQERLELINTARKEVELTNELDHLEEYGAAKGVFDRVSAPS